MAQREWTVMIADDEPAARRGVRQLLAAFPEFRVVSECRNGAEVLNQLDVAEPDLLFLDIQMPGIDGFDVIRQRTPEAMPTVVFLTAYDQFALDAFDAHAFDYLVKPVSAERFSKTMARVRRRFDDAPALDRQAGVVVTTPRESKLIRFHEIDWISSEDNYARVWIGTRSHLVREPLAALEIRSKPFGFARAHRGALVRLSCVRSVSKTTDGEMVAVLSSGTRIPVARRRRAGFSRAALTELR